jgi:hypothetical protein
VDVAMPLFARFGMLVRMVAVMSSSASLTTAFIAIKRRGNALLSFQILQSIDLGSLVIKLIVG